MENYIENFNDNELTKDFSLAKIYEHQSIGYSVDRELKTHLESALFDHMDLFLDQWFQDNPRRRFWLAVIPENSAHLRSGMELNWLLIT